MGEIQNLGERYEDVLSIRKDLCNQNLKKYLLGINNYNMNLGLLFTHLPSVIAANPF
jgi:hypothetical protein